MPAWLLTLLPLLAKVPKLAKAFYKSKAFWPAVTTGGVVGATAVSELGRAGERKMSKEQLETQRLLMGKAAEAGKKQTEESRKHTEKMIKELTKIKKEEETKEREDALMQTFLASQNQQMTTTMQALSGMSTRPSGSSAGMLGVMRSNY